jgi:hypothetical protein
VVVEDFRLGGSGEGEGDLLDPEEEVDGADPVGEARRWVEVRLPLLEEEDVVATLLEDISLFWG